jgi:novobiocin biosynthesis protein NovU/D-mycarose 3-C-methyltransferase
MSGAVERITECRVCGTDDWLEVLSFGDTTLANGFVDPGEPAPEPTYPLEVAVCWSCRLMSLMHVVDPEALFGDYVYTTSESDLIAEHMARVVASATRRAGLAPGDLVVEFGSNDGAQLALFAARGQRVVGVDPARNLAAAAEARGVPTVSDFFGERSAARVLETYGEAGLVLGRQCFAHIPNVHDVLRGATSLLAPDGLLVIEVPHVLHLLAENQFDTIFHEHVSYFSFGTLEYLFGRHGLRMVDVEEADVHGGSILVSAAFDGSPHTVSPSVGRMREREQQAGLYGDTAYREFADRARAIMEGLRTLVRGLVAEGASVAGYGAPSKGCALLEFCGLDSRDLVYVTDTTAGKQGRLTPATHIPVRSPNEAAADPPDYYLILAWNYADEILRKERAYLASGGRMIMPIPTPRVLTAAGSP